MSGGIARIGAVDVALTVERQIAGWVCAIAAVGEIVQVCISPTVADGLSLKTLPSPYAPNDLVVPYRFPFLSRTRLPNGPSAFPEIVNECSTVICQPLPEGDNSKTDAAKLSPTVPP